MNKTALAIATAVSLTFAAGTLSANEGMGGESEMKTGMADFADLDQNNDGMLDENELNAYGSTAAGPAEDENPATDPATDAGQSPIGSADQMLEKYDENQDGAISEEEWPEDTGW